ncbi:nitrogen regulation protein NR(II) [Pseudomonas sp. NA-150]|uniref:two-component system sensor histidine kinase NtrB n=1 Tax=Pseudomonas sp. NA-150 TaxID=3367525 RepID=UPI0037C7B57C
MLTNSSLLIRASTFTLATLIFIIDAFTPMDIAIAVLYVLVVLMAANEFSRGGLITITLGCMGLTLVAFFIDHDVFMVPPLGRCVISLAAICISGALALRNNTITSQLQEQVKLLGQTHDAIVVRDMQHRILSWNPGAEALYGWSAKEVLGKKITDLLQSKISASFDEIMRIMLAEGAWEGEITSTCKNGRRVTVTSRWSLSRDRSGNPRTVLVTNNDITAARQAEEALHRSQVELAHITRVTTLGELAASIAHEVNQPLAAVTTNAEAGLRWLNREVPDLGEVRSAISRISSEAQRAGEVIKRIRALSRKSEPHYLPLELGEVVEESLGLLKRELVQQSVSLRLELAEGLPAIQGDRVQLQQVLINLVMNGIQAMSKVNEAQRVMSIKLARVADQLNLEIHDSGPGIREQDMTKLFTAFFTTKEEGLGMGLSICRSIVEAHGGHMGVRNLPEIGAALQVVLPVPAEVGA